ncbi:protein containing Glycoside hydrolase, family 13, partial [mine drainage metagenome]
MKSSNIKRGNPYPLGATLMEDGVNFAVYSENAESINIDLFEECSSDPVESIQLKEQDGYV